MSIMTMSDARPITVSVYAMVEPTLPVPIMEILFMELFTLLTSFQDVYITLREF